MTGSVLFYLMSSSAGFSLGTVYLKRFADAGIDRSILSLPSASRDEVLPLLDTYAALVGA